MMKFLFAFIFVRIPTQLDDTNNCLGLTLHWSEPLYSPIIHIITDLSNRKKTPVKVTWWKKELNWIIQMTCELQFYGHFHTSWTCNQIILLLRILHNRISTHMKENGL